MADKSSSRKENRQKATLDRLLPHDKPWRPQSSNRRLDNCRSAFALAIGYEEFPLRSAKPSPNPQEAGSMRSGGPAASVVLEIGRGRTEQRRRPVQSSRFLIGSSSRCDLCMGGGAIPPLHSLLSIEGGEVWLEAIAGAPDLLVNDRAEKCVRLKDQDRVRIEPFELIVHLTCNAAAAVESAKAPTPPLADQSSESSE